MEEEELIETCFHDINFQKAMLAARKLMRGKLKVESCIQKHARLARLAEELCDSHF